MLKIAGQFRRLIAICVAAPGGRFSLLLFAVVLGLNLSSIYLTLRLVKWTGEFYSAVEKLNGQEALRQIGIFALIIATTALRGLVSQYLRKRLELRWRRDLTNAAIERWMAGKAYWHLARGAESIDNPDQRIAEDCRLFVRGLLSEALDLIERVIGLFSYVAVLWGLSNFPLSLAFIGLDLEIPHYMVWSAFIYVALSCGVTHLLGRPLKGLLAEQQKREASFRFAMARWRTAFDEVALSGGEEAEKRTFRNRFDAIADNWHRLIRREAILGAFTYPFQFTVLRIPLFVALPGYFAGHIAFGGLMQLASAFSQVVTTLSWFIFSYRDLADLVATSSRLDTFMEAAKRHAAAPSGFERRHGAPHARLEGVRIETPQGMSLIALDDFTLKAGETVWLQGPSGLGKTTLVKALAGFWPHGAGRIAMPEGTWMFLPQKPWLPADDLYAAAAYPLPAAQFGGEAIDAALNAVGLGGRGRESAEGLSGGELQRLAIARVLLHRPEWVVLDEATSALDKAAEDRLLALLRENLPGTAFIVIAHREPQAIQPMRRIDLAAAPPLAATG